MIRRTSVRIVIAHVVASYLVFPLSWHVLPYLKRVPAPSELFLGLTTLAYVAAPISVPVVFPGFSVTKYREEPRVLVAHFDWGCWWCYVVPLIMMFLALRPLGIHAQRRFDGLCVTCGYDLRASPDRCPECGTIPTVLERAAS